GRGPAGSGRQHDGRRNSGQVRRRPIAGHRRSGHRPEPGSDREGHQVPFGQLDEGGGLTLARKLRDALPLLPFLAVVVIFLIIPTVTVIVSAFFADGAFSLARIEALFSGTALAALWKSVLLSASTALIGAFF